MGLDAFFSRVVGAASPTPSTPVASTSTATPSAGGINGKSVNGALGGVRSANMALTNDAGTGMAGMADGLTQQVGNTMRATSAMTDQALDYNTAARREGEAAKAVADVNTALAGNQDATLRRNSAMGINPLSGRAQASALSTDVNGALAKVSAANGARKAVEDAGFNRLAEVSKQGIALTQPALAAYGGQMDADKLNEAVRQADNSTAYQWEGLDRQTAQNAAELALKKYATEKGIQLDSSKLDSLQSAANGNAWASGLSAGAALLSSTGLGSKLGDWVSSW